VMTFAPVESIEGVLDVALRPAEAPEAEQPLMPAYQPAVSGDGQPKPQPVMN
jgi:hypothetical protein